MTTACVACDGSLPSGARFCGHCGAPQAPADAAPGVPGGEASAFGGQASPAVDQPTLGGATDQPTAVGPGPSGGQSRLLFIVAGVGVALVLGWLGLSAITGGAGGAADAIVALEGDGSFGDLYLLDRVEDAENPDRDDRVLRDVRVQGVITQAVDGSRTQSYGTFDYGYEGGPLFVYQEDGDDEWVMAILDGREVVEIEQFDSRPQILETASGVYVVDQEAGSCSIHRLDGRSADRVARADSCIMNGTADIAVLADVGSSETEVSVVDLASGDRTTVAEFDDAFVLRASFTQDNEVMMVSPDNPTDPETVVVELATGDVLVEERVHGQYAASGGFFAQEIDNSGGRFETTLSYHTFDGDSEDVVSTDGVVNVQIDQSGTSIAVIEIETDDDPIVSMAEIDSSGVGPLTEIGEFRGRYATWFVGDGQLLVVDDDGVVSIADGQDLNEIGELSGRGNTASPVIQPTSGEAWLVSMGESVGLVVGSSNPTFIEIDDLESYSYGRGSADGRWLAIVGSENISGSDQSLVLVELSSGENEVIDEDDRISNVQFSGGDLYFEVESNGEREVRRTPLGFGERVEDLAEGVRLYVPGEPAPSLHRNWDVLFWSVG